MNTIIRIWNGFLYTGIIVTGFALLLLLGLFSLLYVDKDKDKFTPMGW